MRAGLKGLNDFLTSFLITIIIIIFFFNVGIITESSAINKKRAC